jgi:hypothetical protein
VAKNLEKHAIGVPWGAAADEFPVSCAKGVEDGVVEFLVVGYKVEFVRIDYMEGWASDGFGVVGEGFYAASVGEVNLGFLCLRGDSGREFSCVGCYACYDTFSLPPRRPYNADCNIRVFYSVPKQECGYGLGLTALSTPPSSSKLVVLKNIDELFLVPIEPAAKDLFYEINRVIAQVLGLLMNGLFKLKVAPLRFLPCW